MSTLRVCIKQYDHEEYGVLYDVGHGWVGSTDDYPIKTEEEARAEMQRIIAYHRKPKFVERIIDSVEIAL